MPRGDGTGHYGEGPGTGRGLGRGGGRDRINGNRPGAGSTGNCVCLSCGTKVPYQAGVPCYDAGCPRCGAKMIRE